MSRSALFGILRDAASAVHCLGQPRRSALAVVVMAAALLGVGLAGPALLSAQAQAPVTVRLEPAAASGSVDDVFTVQVYVDNVPATGVQGWEVSISFDPTVVRLQSGQGNNTYFDDNVYDAGGYNAFPVAAPAADSITVGQVLLGVPSAYPSGSNLLLATIQWQAVGDGAAALDIYSARIIQDALDGEVYASTAEVDGQILVGGAAPLAPTAALPTPTPDGALAPTPEAVTMLSAATPTPESAAVAASDDSAAADGDSPAALSWTIVLAALLAIAVAAGGVTLLARRRTH